LAQARPNDAFGGAAGAGKRRPRGRGGGARTCLAARRAGPRDRLIRFVITDDGALVPDVAEKLPGRGLWLEARREIVTRAAAKGLFARAARRAVTAPDDLADRVEALLARRSLEWLGLARRAGLLVLGFDKIRAAFERSRPAVLVEAADGGADGRARLLAWARAVGGDMSEASPVLGCFTSAELGLALGQVNVVHGALRSGGATERLIREMRRLAGFRPLVPDDWPCAWDPVVDRGRADAGEG